MSRELTPTTVTETLDERGLLNAARGPGVYALAVVVPDTVRAVERAWDDEFDVRPGDDALARLADAADVAYVGASGNVYDRLTDHAAGNVRQTAFLSVFEPVHILDVWPADNPFEVEYRRALALATDDWTVWVDGEVVG